MITFATVGVLTAPFRHAWAADPPPGDDTSAAGCPVHPLTESPRELQFRDWMAQAEAGGKVLAPTRNLVVMTWRREIEALRSAPALQQMKRVNSLVNNLVQYRPDADAETWGEPLQTLNKGGDCEDYALLKAYSLVSLGWPRQDLHFAVGRLADGRRHAMLSVALDGKAYLLDNLTRQPIEANRYPWQPLYRLGLIGSGP